jgi:hypothetical protein
VGNGKHFDIRIRESRRAATLESALHKIGSEAT